MPAIKTKSKNKNKPITKVSKPSRSKKLFVVFVAIFVVIGGFILYRSFAATTSGINIATVEAETLTGSGSVLSESLGATQYLRLSNGTPAAKNDVSLSTSSDQIIIKARGEQCNGSPTMIISVDNQDVATLAVSSTTWTDYPISLKTTTGVHAIAVRMTNPYTKYKGGTTKVVCERALNLDKILFRDVPPSVNVAKPYDGAGVKGVIPISVSATDLLGVNKVELYIDNQIFGSTLSTGPYNWSWDADASSVAKGSHSIYSKAYDTAGNVGISPIITVIKDNCYDKSVPGGVSTSYTMTLCDDFTGNSINTNNWEDCSWSQSDACHGNKLTNQQLEWNRLSNCTVSNDSLNLTATRGNYTSSAGYTYPWTSCLLATKNVRIQYGYIEERAIFPTETGFWPAFWTYQPPGANYNVETDVYEYYSDNKTKLYLTQQQGGGNCILPLSFDPTANFHIYGANITPSGTYWYIDGQQVCSTPNTSTNLAAVITNLAVYAKIPPDAATNQATKRVDYIKVFQ